ncbi:MAG: hypothetical protein MUF54_09180 [Polyangiaceae bacterium]|nr:hypothetical protein [Polyangiaceae bacterium]
MATRPRVGGQVAPTLAEPMDGSVNEAANAEPVTCGAQGVLAHCLPSILDDATAHFTRHVELDRQATLTQCSRSVFFNGTQRHLNATQVSRLDDGEQLWTALGGSSKSHVFATAFCLELLIGKRRVGVGQPFARRKRLRLAPHQLAPWKARLASGAPQDAGNVVVLVGFLRPGGLTC